MPPNKHMLRAVTHKVLGRGRPSLVPCSAQRARVLIGLRAGADVGRYAACWLRSRAKPIIMRDVGPKIRPIQYGLVVGVITPHSSVSASHDRGRLRCRLSRPSKARRTDHRVRSRYPKWVTAWLLLQVTLPRLAECHSDPAFRHQRSCRVLRPSWYLGPHYSYSHSSVWSGLCWAAVVALRSLR